MSKTEVTQVTVGTSGNKKVKMEFFTDEDFKTANPYTPEEQAALCQKLISDGCIINPLVVWEGNGTLVYGYQELAIAEEFDLPYEVKYLKFESKDDCMAWLGEKRLSVPSLNLFQRIEIAKKFVAHWIAKDEAKHKKDSPLRKAAMEKFGRDDKLAIVALKSGTSHNTVNKVNKILDFGDNNIIEQVRHEKISITNACELIQELGDTIPQDELTPAQVLEAEEKKAEANTKKKDKEVHVLAKYSVEGFHNNEKLDEIGMKYFIYRWDTEHPDNTIDVQMIDEAIKNYGK